MGILSHFSDKGRTDTVSLDKEICELRTEIVELRRDIGYLKRELETHRWAGSIRRPHNIASGTLHPPGLIRWSGT